MRANKIPTLVQPIGHVLQEVPYFLLGLEHVVHGELGTHHIEEHVLFNMTEELTRGTRRILLDKRGTKVPKTPHFTTLGILNSLVGDIYAIVVTSFSNVPLAKVTTLTTSNV